MAKFAPHTEVIREFLKDREWHTHDEVIARGGTAIPPGRAMRRWEVNRKRDFGKRGIPPEQIPPAWEGKYARGDRDSALESGRRALVQDSISSLLQSGYLEKRKLNGQTEYRLRDERAAVNIRGVPTREINLTQARLRSLIRTATTVMEADQTPASLVDRLSSIIADCQKLLENAPNLRRLTSEERRRAYADTRLGE